jgi:ectoine hydroxylase-related dioxygenase (phytanoyl-CoA dioxygenase family)
MVATDLSNIREQYERDGFVIIRNAIDPALAEETSRHVDWLLEKNPGIRPEQLHHHLLRRDPFMHRLTGDDRLLDIVEPFIGSNIALFAAHYIANAPFKGQPVLWHQDGSYWPLEPMEVITIWLAATDSTKENGCMRIIPGTQHQKLLTLREMQKTDGQSDVLGYGIDPRTLDEDAAVDIELKAGDVSIHHPNVIHGSNPNNSPTWRKGLTLRYIPTSTRILREDHGPFLLRGQAVPGVNEYEPRPRFIPGQHMPFAGCETWNDDL